MPGRPRSRPRHRVRVPAVVLAAGLAFAALGVLWSVVAPLDEAPDEPAHLGLVLHLADGRPYPDYDQLRSPASVYRLCRTFAAATRACPREGEPVTITSTRRHLAADAPDKSIRPAWNDGGGARPGGLNQMAQHPPLYYEAMALVLRAERTLLGGPWSLDRELALLRLANVALVSPLPVLAWWAAKRARLGRQVAVVASLGPPGPAHAGPHRVHGEQRQPPDALRRGGPRPAGWAWPPVTAASARRWASAPSAPMAMLTKVSAVVLLPAIVVAYLVGCAGPTGRRASTSCLTRSAILPALAGRHATMVVGFGLVVPPRARPHRSASRPASRTPA